MHAETSSRPAHFTCRRSRATDRSHKKPSIAFATIVSALPDPSFCALCTANHSYAPEFDLPLKDKDLGPHLGPDMCSLGFGLPRRGVTKNPMSDPFAQHLLAVYKQQRNYGAPLWDGIGELLAEHPARELTDYMESVLKKVAYNPTLRLQSKLGLKPSEIVKDEGAESSEESDDEGAESSEEEDDEGAEHSEESDNGGAEPTSEDDSEK